MLSAYRFHFPPVTGGMLLIMFILLPLGAILLPLGAGCNACIAQGEWWRLMTPIFLHADIGHLLSNGVCLLMLGFFLETQLNRFLFLLLFLASGLIGNIVTFLIAPDAYTHIGASGAVFGLLGAQIYILYLQRQRYGQRETAFLILSLLLMLSATLLDPSVNVLSHLGGLLTGGLLMPLLYKE